MHHQPAVINCWCTEIMTEHNYSLFCVIFPTITWHITIKPNLCPFHSVAIGRPTRSHFQSPFAALINRPTHDEVSSVLRLRSGHRVAPAPDADAVRSVLWTDSVRAGLREVRTASMCLLVPEPANRWQMRAESWACRTRVARAIGSKIGMRS